MFSFGDFRRRFGVPEDINYKNEEHQICQDNQDDGGQKERVEGNTFRSNEAHRVSKVTVIREGEVTHYVVPSEDEVTDKRNWQRNA